MDCELGEGYHTGTMLRVVNYSALVALATSSIYSAANEDAFAVDAYQLLQARCFECHGNDRLRGGLALNMREDALEGGDSGTAAFVPGDADSSLILERVQSADPSERMPYKSDPLSEDEIALLVKWIDAGAPFAENAAANKFDHWAFVAPKKTETPEVQTARALRNPIDTFIEKALEEQGLTLSREADKYSLIRRAYLELVGKPPSPQAVRKFVRDKRPDVYEQLVDELIASPHYGERQARRWLDVARYADTNGYEKDRPRSIWPYRDWVIDAFNTNMPFDQFTVEQIAGDLLPNATQSQRIATGFHRNAMLNEEGGIDVAEDWFKRSVDRANTTATVFFGLTMSCGQCHSHKYDPITQREYYRFFAFFNDAGEDNLRLPDADVEAERARIDERVDELETFMAWAGGQIDADGFDRWVADTREKSAQWTVATATAESEKGATLTALNDGSILATGDIPNDDTYTLTIPLDGTPVSALRLETLPHETLPGSGPGRGVILSEGDFLLTEIKAEVVTGSDVRDIQVASATADFAAEGREPGKALDGRADTGWSINGATRKPHAAVFSFESPVTATDASLRVTLEQDYIHQHTIGRFRVSTTSKSGTVVASGVPADLESHVLATSLEHAIADPKLQTYYYANVTDSLKEWRKKRDELIKSKPEFDSTLIMTARETPRVTRMYHRGEFLQPRNEVQPGVPRILHAFPENVPRNRLGLAQWLVSEENPLVGRVTMNRLWQQVFGRGLVNTPEDFGVRGEAPSHPELLDWLAVEFAQSGWDMKTMHRLMVTSAAFRQDSAVSPAILEADPDNRLLSRGPRFRVAAEVVRDIALEASGLMNPAIGGASIYPPQPDGVTALAYGRTNWPTSEGPDRFRRGLYVYWKRTAPYAASSTFDAPTGETACVERRRTNTPLQALTLMNDQVFTEAAQAMAGRILEERSRLSKRIDRTFMLTLSRPPTRSERGRVRTFYRDATQRLKQDPARASEIAGDAEGDPPIKLAVWTLICRAILNLDETITQG